MRERMPSNKKRQLTFGRLFQKYIGKLGAFDRLKDYLRFLAYLCGIKKAQFVFLVNGRVPFQLKTYILRVRG